MKDAEFAKLAAPCQIGGCHYPSLMAEADRSAERASRIEVLEATVKAAHETAEAEFKRYLRANARLIADDAALAALRVKLDAAEQEIDRLTREIEVHLDADLKSRTVAQYSDLFKELGLKDYHSVFAAVIAMRDQRDAAQEALRLSEDALNAIRDDLIASDVVNAALVEQVSEGIRAALSSQQDKGEQS